MATSPDFPPLALLAAPPRAAELRAESVRLRSWDLTADQLGDLELLLQGAYAPLRGYLRRADCDSVCERMRLAGGALWPWPVTLDVTAEFAETLTVLAELPATGER